MEDHDCCCEHCCGGCPGCACERKEEEDPDESSSPVFTCVRFLVLLLFVQL